MTTNTNAALIAALEVAQAAINSMKVEAETAAQGDEQMMLEACEQISNEGLEASEAIRAALTTTSAATVPPAGWVMMPVEPTPEIVKAIDGVMWPGASEKAYRAMLAAAPKAEPVPAGEYPALPEPDIHYRFCDSTMRYMDATAYSERAMRAYGEACWKDAYKHAAWGAAQAAPAAVAGPSRDLYPEKCPITGRPFFMVLDHPELGPVPTYGGPFDSYTIPSPEGEPTDLWHERELRSERFDHDAGDWVEGGHPIPLRIVHDDVLFQLQSDAEAAAPTTQAAPQPTVQHGALRAELWKLIENYASACDTSCSTQSTAQDADDISKAQEALDAMLDTLFAATQAAPAAQGDAEDAASWRALAQPTEETIIEAVEASCAHRPSVDDDSYVLRILRVFTNAARSQAKEGA